jgi:hypothetical protein
MVEFILTVGSILALIMVGMALYAIWRDKE